MWPEKRIRKLQVMVADESGNVLRSATVIRDDSRGEDGPDADWALREVGDSIATGFGLPEEW